MQIATNLHDDKEGNAICQQNLNGFPFAQTKCDKVGKGTLTIGPDPILDSINTAEATVGCLSFLAARPKCRSRPALASHRNRLGKAS
jgi:hypothetical protein